MLKFCFTALKENNSSCKARLKQIFFTYTALHRIFIRISFYVPLPEFMKEKSVERIKSYLSGGLSGEIK